MTIDLATAESISGLQVFGLGLGLVFIGLICIIIICSIMGAVCKNMIKEQPSEAAPSATGTVSSSFKNKGEFIAAVSAAIAEELGTDISGIRILSVKKL